MWAAATALAAMIAAAPLAVAGQVFWVGPDSGDWNTPSNWSSYPSCPGPEDDVTIGVNGTVTLSGPPWIKSLICNANLTILSSGLKIQQNATMNGLLTLADLPTPGNNAGIGVGGDLTVNGSMVINSYGSVGVAASHTIIPAGATANMGGGGWTTLVYGENFGVTNHSGTFVLWLDGTFQNHPGATFNESGSGEVDCSNDAPFSNAGTFNKIGDSQLLWTKAFVNSGRMNIQGGTLTLRNRDFANSGNIDVSSGATLIFSVNSTHSAGSSITGAGAVQFASGEFAGQLRSTGSVTMAGDYYSYHEFDFNADQDLAGLLTVTHNVGGSGNITASGSMVWNSGDMLGTGHLIIPAGATLTIGDGRLRRALDNFGSATLASNMTFFGGTFNNNVGATFNAPSSGGFGGSGLFNNAGTLNKSGAGTTTMIAVPFENSGTVNVQAGALWFDAGVLVNSLTEGTWNVASNATLSVTMASFYYNSANVTLDGVGSEFPQLSPLRTNDGSFTITNGRNFTTAGAFTNSGTLTVGPGSTFAVTGGLNNSGLVQVMGGTLTAQGAGSSNSGQFALANGAMARIMGPTPFLLSGSTRISGAGTLEFDGPLAPGAGASIDVAGSTLILNADTGSSRVLGIVAHDGASVHFNSPEHLDTLSLTGASAVVAPGKTNLIVLNSLSFGPGGMLDLADNNLVLHYSGQSAYADVAAWIANHTIVTTGAGPGLAIGLVDNAAIHQQHWHGELLTDASDFDQLLVAVTYPGDVNLDGKVDDLDLLNVFANMGRTDHPTWFEGDVNLDGIVNLADVDIVMGDMNAGTGGSFGIPMAAVFGPDSSDAVTVPEPTSLIALSAALGLLIRRREPANVAQK